MILTVCFKTPDAVEDSIPDIDHCGDHSEYDGSCTACIDYKDNVPWTRRDAREQKRSIIESLSRFTDGEYVTIEFDTEAGTAKVMPRR